MGARRVAKRILAPPGKTKNNDEKIKEQNKKIKVIDYSKLKDIGKKLKNKIGIEKIKIVYFD